MYQFHVIFLVFLLYFENIYSYLNDLKIGIELKILLDPRYSLFDNFISIIKQILFYYYNNIFLISISLIFIILSKFFLKNSFKTVSLILIFLPLFLTNNVMISLLLIVIFYLIFSSGLNNINQISKSEVNYLFFIFILIILLYSFLVGTNTNAVILLKNASIIVFLIFILIILKYHKNKKKYFKNINFFFIILIIFTLNNLYYNFEKPRRYNDKIYNQNKLITLKNFNGDLYVDEITLNFISNFNKILENNNWKDGNYMIDFTGREPGLNLISGAKYVLEPWWGSGYIGAEKKASKLLSIADFKIIKNAWIITTDHNININPKILNNLNLNLNFDYKFVGNIKKKEKNYYIWKPR